MNSEKKEKLLEKLKKPDKKKLYQEETDELLKSRKDEFISDLHRIIKNLESKKDINEFIESKIDYFKDIKLFSDIKLEKRCEVFLYVKICGFLFLSTYLIGIFYLMGVKTSLEGEALDSLIYFIKRDNSTNTTTFYERFSLNKDLPSLSLFFIFSFLSDLCINYAPFPLLVIVMVILNSVILYSFKHFPFLEGKKPNEHYNVGSFVILVLYVLYFNIIFGIMALIPLKMVLTGYFYYEKWLNKIKFLQNDNINIINDVRNDNIMINSSEEMLNKSNEDHPFDIDNEPKNKFENLGKYNGFHISYILSFLIPIFINYNQIVYDDHQDMILNILGMHCIFILMSLITYAIFSYAFRKKKERKNNIYITKFCGYLIFKETKDHNSEVCCEGCRVGMRKFYYFCFCTNCSCCDCLECDRFCPCLPLFECCRQRADLTEIGERDKSLCICYQLNGKCSWICEYFTNMIVFYCTLYILVMELLNFGFKSLLIDCISKKNDYNNKIFYSYILGIIFFYFYQLFNGWICVKCFPISSSRDKSYGEGSLLGAGFFFLILTESIISCIFSSLIYFKTIENIKYQLMAFSSSSTEYIKVMIINQMGAGSEDKAKLLTNSSVISLFLLIFNIIIYIINHSIDDYNIFVFFQIIFSIFITFILVCILVLIKISNKKLGIKKYEDLEKVEKRHEKEKKDMIKDFEEYEEKEEIKFQKLMNEEIQRAKEAQELVEKAMIDILLDNVNSIATNEKDKIIIKSAAEELKRKYKKKYEDVKDKQGKKDEEEKKDEENKKDEEEIKDEENKKDEEEKKDEEDKKDVKDEEEEDKKNEKDKEENDEKIRIEKININKDNDN